MDTRFDSYKPDPGWKGLANAIIKRAADDYMKSLRVLKSNPYSYDAKRSVVECERFFKSGYFRILSDISPTMLLERMKAHVDSEDCDDCD